MKKAIFFFIFISQWCIAQSIHNTDSLLIAINSNDDDTNKVELLVTLCKLKWKYAEYALAKKYADEALLLSQKLNYPEGIAKAYNQTGIVYWYIKDNEAALVYHQKALDIYLKLGNKTGVAEVLNRIGHDYADLPDYTKALLFFRRALELDTQTGNQPGIVKNTDLVGFVYMRLGNYSEALKHYYEALALAEKIKNRRSISAACHDIGEVYEKQNKLNDALKFAKRGLELALEEGEKHLIDEAYQGLEKIYIKQNDFKNAYAIRLKFDDIETELRNADNAGKIKQMQMQFEFDKKQASDSLKIVREKEINEVQLHEQKMLTYMGFAGAIISVAFLIFMYSSYKKQRVINERLREAQSQLIQSEKLAAFGILASRMAHEIQNPLNFVNNFSEMSVSLLDDVMTPKGEEEKKENEKLLKENLRIIREHGKRAAGIVRQLESHISKGTAHEFFEKEKGNEEQS
jgi:tetratricopeptide (TPR) repeat protein